MATDLTMTEPYPASGARNRPRLAHKSAKLRKFLECSSDLWRDEVNDPSNGDAARNLPWDILEELIAASMHASRQARTTKHTQSSSVQKSNSQRNTQHTSSTNSQLRSPPLSSPDQRLELSPSGKSDTSQVTWESSPVRGQVSGSPALMAQVTRAIPSSPVQQSPRSWPTPAQRYRGTILPMDVFPSSDYQEEDLELVAPLALGDRLSSQSPPSTTRKTPSAGGPTPPSAQIIVSSLDKVEETPEVVDSSKRTRRFKPANFDKLLCEPSEIVREIPDEAQVESHATPEKRTADAVESAPASTSPYATFVATYPSYAPDVHTFIRACLSLQDVRRKRLLPMFLCDDFIRAFSTDYIDYIVTASTRSPLTAAQWYVCHVEKPVFVDSVVSWANVDDILAYHQTEVDEIGI